MTTALLIAAIAAQGIALLILVGRLWPGRTRRPPVQCSPTPVTDTSVSVIVATLNEAERIGPCLDGLRAQRCPVLEILVVDSRSTDATREIVERAAALDPRIRLLTDPPLPPRWVGKVWALEHGLRAARGEWILGIDADTQPMPGMAAGAITAARQNGFDVVSFSPRFANQTAGERLLQPAMLVTLVYRGGAAGAEADPENVMANGQCFLAKRSTLERHGGYEAARESFADDVTLARHLTRNGAKVGFLDGSLLYLVRSYSSAAEMWREWGRSLDLRDATPASRQLGDILLLIATQALPVPMLLLLGLSGFFTNGLGLSLMAVNFVLLAIRLLLLIPISKSYHRTGVPFWMSWIADPLAVARIVLSTLSRARAWRGRQYQKAGYLLGS